MQQTVYDEKMTNVDKKKVYLHAGMTKTGTTAIQSWLEANQAKLQADRLYYPVSSNASGGMITRMTSGNAARMSKSLDDLNHFFDETSERFGDMSIVLSNENSAIRLTNNGLLDEFFDKCLSLGFDSIEVLLFVRNPIEHASSQWNQIIMNGAAVPELDEFLVRQQYWRTISEFIKICDSLSYVNLSVRNYTSVRKNLIEHFAKWLNVNPDAYNAVGSKKNRSLSREEIEFRRILNKHQYPTKRVFDSLCNELPDIEPMVLMPSKSAQEEFLNSNKIELDLVNSKLESSESIRLESINYEAEQGELGSLSWEQIEVIGGSFCELLMEQQTRLSNASNRLQATKTARDRIKDELDRTKHELDVALADISARRSKLASSIDYFDYLAHRALGELPFASDKFRGRFLRGAKRRFRERYGARGSRN